MLPRLATSLPKPSKRTSIRITEALPLTLLQFTPRWARYTCDLSDHKAGEIPVHAGLWASQSTACSAQQPRVALAILGNLEQHNLYYIQARVTPYKQLRHRDRWRLSHVLDEYWHLYHPLPHSTCLFSILLCILHRS